MSQLLLSSEVTGFTHSVVDVVIINSMNAITYVLRRQPLVVAGQDDLAVLIVQVFVDLFDFTNVAFLAEVEPSED